MQNKDYRKADYDWKDFTKETNLDYSNALETGDFEKSRAHSLAEGGVEELQFGLSIMRTYLKTVPTGRRVLDVASGSGYLTYCWAELGYDPVGLELLPEGVALANSYYPELKFVQGDGTQPKRIFGEGKFDMVFIREFHPFVRVDDLEYQIGIISDYLDLLVENGVLIIAQSRRADFPNLRLEGVSDHFCGGDFAIAGPLFHFPHKHLKITAKFKMLNSILSSLTRLYVKYSGKYPVEYYFLQKMDDCKKVDSLRDGL